MFFYTMDISNFLVMFNSATNFLVYWNSDLSLGSFLRRAKQSKETLAASKTTLAAGASRSLLDDSYSQREMQMLSMTYFHLWCTQDGESGLTLGQRQMVRFLEIKTHLTQTLGIDNVSCEDWPQCTRLLTLGDKIGSFFGSLIMINRRGSLIIESRNLGRHHYKLGKSNVFFRCKAWCRNSPPSRWSSSYICITSYTSFLERPATPLYYAAWGEPSPLS